MSAARIELLLHICGFLTCCLALISPVVLSSGLMMLFAAYSMHLAKSQGDKYGIWYDEEPAKESNQPESSPNKNLQPTGFEP